MLFKIKTFLIIPLLLPFSVQAAIATPWSATSTDKGSISPNLINGSSPWLVVSGTGTSTYAGPVRSTCFTVNGTTCLSVGTGTVTSVAATVPTFLSISGSPITTSGTLAITLSGTALPVLNGGTGTTTAPSGQLLYGGSSTYQSVATTSVTCSGSTTCTSFTAIGNSPVTISSVATGSGLSTTTPLSAGNLLAYSATGAGSAYGTATSTLNATSPLTGSFTQVGSGGALGIQVANTSQDGYLSSTDWNRFNGKLSSALAKGNFLVGDDSGAAQATSTIFITSTGNVGIGTTTPSSRLNVYGSDSGIGVTNASVAMVDVTNSNTTANNFSDLAFSGVNSTGSSVVDSKVVGVHVSHTAAAESGSIAFLTRNAGSLTEKMRILNTGGVGIGTNAPTALLQTAGIFTSSGSTLVNFGGTLSSSVTTTQIGTSFSPTFLPTGASLATINNFNIAPTLSGSTAINITNAYNVTNASISIGAGYTGTILKVQGYVFNTPTLNGANPIGTVNAFVVQPLTNGNASTTGTITNTGYLGSGPTAASGGATINNYTAQYSVPTGNPTAGTNNNFALYITGSGAAGGAGGTLNQYALYDDSTANNYFAGNVGVGSTTPGSLLSIGNSGWNFYDNATSTKGGTGGINITDGCYAKNGVCISTGGSSITGTQGQVAYFSGTNTAVGTSTLFITPAGNVGLGTITPTDVNTNARLTISGISSQDVIASTTDNTTLSDAIFRVYAPGSSLFMGSHGTNQVTTQYGITVGGWGEIGAVNSTSGTSNGLLIGTRTTATPIVFGTNSIERMRILSGGNVGVATSTPWRTLSVTGTVGFDGLSAGAGTSLCISANKEVVTCTGGGTVTSIATNNGITGGTITTTGTIGLAAVAANSVLGNVTGASGVPSAVATSSLFTGTTGQGAYFASTGGLVGTSTLFITAGATVGVGTTTTVYGASSFTQAISNGVTALGGLLINTVTNVTNAFSIFNAAGANVFNVDTTASNPFLGVGTSTPSSTVSAVGNGTTPIFALASTTNSGLPNFSVDKTGIVVTSGVKPVVSSCGTTNSISGNDTAGSIMFTGTLVTTCTMTFATPVPAGQTLGCIVSDNSTTGFSGVTATSSTAVTFGISTGLASGAFFYSCNRWQ